MRKNHSFKKTAIVIAISAVFPVSTVWADEVEELISPNVAEVTVKLPYMDKVNPLYRQYNGVNQEGISGSLDFDYLTRKEADWFRINARNLGLRTQEIGVSYEKQGDWSIGLNYDQIPRFSPYDVRTAVGGVGTNTIVQPNVTNTAAAQDETRLSNVTLMTQRDITTLKASKFVSEGLALSFTFKNEDKTGTRMNGVRGVAASGASPVNIYSGFLFAPEPIKQNHKEFEATIDYTTAKYQITAGYYGSYLSAQNSALSVQGGTTTQPWFTSAYPSISPIALAPDNSLQQFYVNGAYNFSSDTRANLKIAYSEGRQTDQFIGGQPMSTLIGTNLDGRVQTTDLFASLTSRITKDLKLLASWRYEDRKDKTPRRDYGAWQTGSYDSFKYNNPESHVANWGKLEADYRLGGGYALTAGLDYSTKSSVNWQFYEAVNTAPDLIWKRHDISETTTRLALRKSMSESLNGNLIVSHAERKGSEWKGDQPVAIYPVYLADRTRDKIRGMLDWAATETLNLQASYEAYFDDYSKSAYGLSKGNGQVFSLDGSYTLSDVWKMNAWYSKQLGDTTQNSQGAVCTTTNGSNCSVTTFRTGTLVQWDAKLKQDSDQFGFGATGKIKVFDVGAQYLFARDLNKQEISAMPGTTCTTASCSPPLPVAAGNGILPDTKYTQNTVKLFGVYPVSKATKVRLDYIYDLRKMDDYTWSQWRYADGTRVLVKPEQTTQIIGLSLSHAF